MLQSHSSVRGCTQPPPASIKLEHGYARDEPVSAKLMPLTSMAIYEVYKITGASHVILCDPDTRSTELGFSQPVAIDRLVRYDLCNVEIPIEAEYPVRIEIVIGNQGMWRRGTIMSWSGTGKVFLKFDDNTEEVCLELADHEHRYVYPNEQVLVSTRDAASAGSSSPASWTANKSCICFFHDDPRTQ